MSLPLLLFSLSAFSGITAYIFYTKDAWKMDIGPNRWSWLIWSVTTLIEVLTYSEISGDPVKSAVFYISAAMCIIATIAVWRKGKWETPSLTEILCVVVSVVAVILWLYYRLTWWAHLLMIAAIPVSFIPTYLNAWKNYKHEDTPSWLFWTIGDTCALLLVLSRLDKYEEIPYASVEALCHALVLILILARGGATLAFFSRTKIFLTRSFQMLGIITSAVLVGSALASFAIPLRDQYEALYALTNYIP